MNIDPITRMHEAAPLVRFSPYTQIQVRTTIDLGQKIVELFETSMNETTIQGEEFTNAYGYFWLWVLATYEISRTLCQRRECLSEDLANRICNFKKQVSVLRMPFAKLEYPGTKEPIRGEASVNGIDTARKDILFEVKGEVISARQLISEFEQLIGSVRSTDIRKSIYGQEYYPAPN